MINKIKQKLETLNKGCRRMTIYAPEIGVVENCSEDNLCPLCKARKELFTTGCLMMIESELEFLNWIKYRDDGWNEKAIHNKIKEFLSLKEYLLGEIGK
jgi:hypothetical protein